MSNREGIAWTFAATIFALCILRWAFGVGAGVVDRVVNPDAIITNYEWFTPDGEYMETTLHYVVTDRPHKINTPISISVALDPEKK